MRSRGIVLVVAVVLLLMTVAGSNALVLDNGGSGYWRIKDVFPLTAPITGYAQYMIKINGSTIQICNSTGYLKATLNDPSFWNYVNKSGADIRLANQSTQLYFWISDFNSTTQTATIWVNVTPGTDEIDMYYGNPSATPSTYDNGSKVFLFYDDFSTNTIGTKWTALLGTWTISNGALYVSTSYTSAPGNIIESSFSGTDYVAYVKGMPGSAEFGAVVNMQSTSYFGYAGVVYSAGYLIEVDYWNGAWSTGTYIAGTVGEYQTYTMRVIVNGTKVIATNLNTGSTVSETLAYSSGYFGLHNAASPTVPAKFYLVYIAGLADPATFGTPYSTTTGKTIFTAAITNITYNSYDITGKLMINNSTALLTPEFVYVPSNTSATGYLATGEITVPGAANITIYLDSNLTLNQVVCNGTLVTPNYLGTYTTSTGEVFNVYNFTSPSAGLLVVTANTTPVCIEYDESLIRLADIPTLQIIQQMSVNNVNTTYGANITVYLNSKLSTEDVIYNGTSILANLTYLGTATKNGQTYKEYCITEYQDGILNISQTTPNLAYNTTIYADGVPATFAITGEPIKIVTPATANITVNNVEYTNTNTVSKTFFTPCTVDIAVYIFNETSLQFGYHLITYLVKWGEVNVSIIGCDNNSWSLPIGIYNINYSKVCTNPHALLAGWNKLTVYYLGLPVKEYTFYLNHTNNGQQINLSINATKMSSPCYNMTVVSPTQFKVTNLHKIIPFGKFAVNHSSEVIIKFTNNAPVTVTVTGGSYTYYAPYLYIYGAGNATVTSYYNLKLDAESALGVPMNITVNVNGEKVPVYGSTNKVMPVDHYILEFPQSPYGFLLKNSSLEHIRLNLTTNSELPTAVYKVPTHLEISAYKINTTSFKFPFLPIPIPFARPSDIGGDTFTACISGTLYNWYSSPVPDANITIKITSMKTGYTVTKTVNTGSSGSFTAEFNVSTGVNYTITAEYAGSPVYIGCKKELEVAGGALPPAPQKKVNAAVIIVAATITVVCAGVAAAVYFMRKKRLTKAMIQLEKKSKYFKRVKKD